MSAAPRKSNFLVYALVLILAAALVVFVFLRQYEQGEQVGQSTPEPEGGREKATGPAVNERALARDTGLAAQGQTSYAINCASCHGADGTGKGDRAASLNPPPRNFKSEQFKFGADIVSIHNTILKGSPGTSMPSFALLSPEETWALAHFVYSLVPSPPPITDELLAQLPEGGESGGDGTGAGGTGAEGSQGAASAGGKPGEGEGPRIPILVAMDLMASEPAPTQQVGVTPNPNHPGAAIYAQRCAACHGPQGEGVPSGVISVAPYRFQYTASLAAVNSPWVRDRNQFAQIVVKGLPGRSMPGNATLTRQQVDQLWSYVRSFSKAP